jgi:LacI family transcriptional regulator
MKKTNGDNAPGNYPTLQDIAERCGVSRATASRALRNVSGEQSPETANRIAAVAREMGYDPMRFSVARKLISLRYGKRSLNYIVGFFFYHGGFAGSNYLSRIQQGVISAISQTEFEILTSDFSDREREYEFVMTHPYRSGIVDGALVVEQDPIWRTAYNLLRGEPNFGSRPLVGLVSHLEGCSGVFADNFSAGYLSLSHLLQLGHRNILCLQELQAVGHGTLSQRTRGYIRACQEAGLEFDSVVRSSLLNSRSPEERGAELAAYLRQNPKVTAIISGNDQMSVELHRAMVREGFRVPEDISLISYDDTDAVTDGCGNNILTTVRLPLNAIGKQGAEMLIRRILGEEQEDRDIILPVELVVRASTAPPGPPRHRQ